MTRFGTVALAATTLLTGLASAVFNPVGRQNVAVYYGSGTGQQRLTTFCADPTIDVIILSFVNEFPQQANGYPGTNFGNQCWATAYPGPGSDPSKDKLLMCPNLAEDLYVCRQNFPKMRFILSLGGDTAKSTYQLTGAAAGTDFANKLWNIFGPRNDTLVFQGLPRPFDYTNNTLGDGVSHEFRMDGFDLDIERPSTDKSAGYIAFAQRLRVLFATDASKSYYLTASPQCTVPDSNLGDTIKAAQFDYLFIQFYNTPACSAKGWISGNPNYVPGGSWNKAGFTFDDWMTFLAGTTQNTKTRLFLTLPGANAAASAGAYLSIAQTKLIASAYYCRTKFAGIGVWEATYAQTAIANGRNFFQAAKDTLKAAGSDTRLSCVS